MVKVSWLWMTCRATALRLLETLQVRPLPACQKALESAHQRSSITSQTCLPANGRTSIEDGPLARSVFE
jgi:hypothetical protein